MKTVPLPPLVTRSRPWSKNWPKNVIHALKGAERPSSGVTLSNEELGDVVRGAEETVEALVCGDDGDAVVEEIVVGAPDEVCACAACDGDGCGVADWSGRRSGWR